MKRLFLLPVLLIGGAIMACESAQITGTPFFDVAGKTDHFLLAGASPDNGYCGLWANDTYNLQITVSNNGDGTFAMHTEYLAGAFVTLGGGSPGCTQVSTPHGTLVLGGIKGHFTGFVDETITSANYNPEACPSRGGGPGGKASGPCSTRTGFIAAVFGPGASESYGPWGFEYRSSDKRLIYNYWRDASADATEGFGDIATQ